MRKAGKQESRKDCDGERQRLPLRKWRNSPESDASPECLAPELSATDVGRRRFSLSPFPERSVVRRSPFSCFPAFLICRHVEQAKTSASGNAHLDGRGLVAAEEGHLDD